MALRWSLSDYKENRGAATKFPGERRSIDGFFCGSDTRLLYVAASGELREYSYPLSGLYGITTTRFGVQHQDSITWFDETETSSQTYLEGSNLVKTTHDIGEFDVIQRDVTIGSTHITSFELRGDYSSSVEFACYIHCSPDAKENRVGQLLHDNVIEIYHKDEHDYLTASTTLSNVVPQVPERFEQLVTADTKTYPQSQTADDYEESRLTGGVYFTAPIDDRTVTIANKTTTIGSKPRESAIEDLTDHASKLNSPDEIERAARESTPSIIDQSDELITTDLRVLDLLAAPTGGRIAGPDFDPSYQYSGGYGYTWFRDDSEIARFLLEADQELGLGLEETHQRSAQLYTKTQLEDGRWPHRVWPMNARLAPGWANGHLEGDDRHYQADQTASVLVFLSQYLRVHQESLSPELFDTIASTITRGVDGLDLSLTSDGIPAECENAWENMKGQFTHTAAGFLHAYSSIAVAPLDASVRARAEQRAHDVYDALDTLWTDDENLYALRLTDGETDARADISTVALIDAHLAYNELGTSDQDRLERLATHLETTFDRLWKETEAIRGLTRFEEDTWRRRSQDSEKVWTVATGWGAHAAEKATYLFSDSDDHSDPQLWADRLFDEIDLNGSLCLSSGYLPEQFFDNGAPDSATPLGWPHAIRLATYALRETEQSMEMTQLEQP